jgi:Tfp pilus assembly PilM family ATPase
VILNRRKGWIGVDVGLRTVKLAQVERVGGELRLCEAVVVQRPAPIDADASEETPPIASADEIRAALSVGKRFSGRAAACLLSMGACDLRALEVPPGNEARQRTAIASQLHGASSRGDPDREFDFWPTDVAGDEPRSDSATVSVLSVSRQWVARLAEDLRQAGLSCQTLDGLPLALARVVRMAASAGDREPVAVVDWGFVRATFYVVMHGRPVFARCLRGCGLNCVTQSLCEALGVSLDEAQRLLTRHGLAESPRGGGPMREELQVVIADAVAPPLKAVVHELNRTLSFLKSQRPTLWPQRIWLLGGGGTVKNIAGFLGARIGVPVRVWGLANASIQDQTATDYPPGILAPAIAASALAWEKP